MYGSETRGDTEKPEHSTRVHGSGSRSNGNPDILLRFVCYLPNDCRQDACAPRQDTPENPEAKSNAFQCISVPVGEPRPGFISALHELEQCLIW